MERNEIRGILVTFFREATKGDYLEALNKADGEIFELIRAKIFLQPVVSINEGNQPENKKVAEVAVCEHDWVYDKMTESRFGNRCSKCGMIK